MMAPAESYPQYLISMYGQALPMLSNGEPALRLIGIEVSEALSILYRYTLDCVTSPDRPEHFDEIANLDLTSIIGNELTVSIVIEGADADRTGGRAVRQISGIITEARFQGAGDRYCRYRLIMQPWLHFTEHRTDYRIFQRQNVVEIVRNVLARYSWPCQLRFESSYSELVYQVQYGESDFAFAQRLMQEHGIYWFFEHASDTHLLILADAPGAHRPSPFVQTNALPCHADSSSAHQEYVNAFNVSNQIHSASWTSGDFNFETPHTMLEVEAKAHDPHAHDPLEEYVWPGDHPDTDQGRCFAEVRMQEISSRNERFHGDGPLRSIVCGTTFVLERHPHARANREYLVTEASLEMHAIAGTSDAGDQCTVACSFVVQPASLQFRPPHDVPRPKTTGPQTAIIAGPAGQEIWTDQYGRVKVKFHWDRAPGRDDNSSCWIRVAFPWATGQYGSVSIPRIGAEVIVDFENGDPDRPIIIGSVYNAANMPPWPLPRNATLTRSTSGGNYELANAIHFEDLMGCEQIWVHAQKDLLTEVENDEVHIVEANRMRSTAINDTTTIGGTRSITVQGVETHVVQASRTRSTTVNDTTSVGGARSITVQGMETHVVEANRTRSIGANDSTSVGSSRSISVQGAEPIP
ncbi:VgrG protein [Candidatus Burkholderia humilis]|nr:VgrG protein [Candidatus Burkholderia humilis]